MQHSDIKLGDLLTTNDTSPRRNVIVVALTAEEFPMVPQPDKLIVVLDDGARLPARAVFLDPAPPTAFVY